MKKLLFIFIIYTNSTLAQSVLDLSVYNVKNISKQELQIITTHLSNDKNVVYISSNFTDSLFMSKINQYRLSVQQTSLLYNSRLDSLANLVIRYNAEQFDQLHHYNKINDFEKMHDLLNLENLLYSMSIVSSAEKIGIFVDLSDYLNGWIKSPNHHKNLISDLPVGVCKVLLRIQRIDNSYKVEEYGILELDNNFSKRDLDNAYRRKNKELINNF